MSTKKTKNEEQETLPAVSETHKAVATKPQASAELLERIATVKENLESLDAIRIPKIKMTGNGMVLAEGEKAVSDLKDVVIIQARAMKVYYADIYDKNDVKPPDCVSANAKTPDATVEKPQAKDCAKCAQNKFGTARVGKGKACRDIKPIYVLLGENSVLPRQLNVTPTSIKAFSDFLLNTTDLHGSYRSIAVNIHAEKDSEDDTYCKLTFSYAGKLSPQRLADVEALRAEWLPHINAVGVSEVEETETFVPSETVQAPSGPVEY